MERTIQAGEIELAALEAGAGGKPLLLVHGFCGGKDDFAWHLDDLAAEGWHVVAPDLRGHGGSVGAPAGYSFDDLACDVIAIADALGWDRFALLGHSMGGLVAQHVALRAGDRLTALVLMDTTAHGPPVEADLVELGVALVRDGGMPALQAALKEVDPLKTPAARRLEETIDDWVETHDARFLSCSPEMWEAIITGWLADATDRLAGLAALDVPTLVIVGEQDEPFLGPSHELARTIPGARIDVILDGGHSPQSEAPDSWRKALLSFLSEVTG